MNNRLSTINLRTTNVEPAWKVTAVDDKRIRKKKRSLIMSTTRVAPGDYNSERTCTCTRIFQVKSIAITHCERVFHQDLGWIHAFAEKELLFQKIFRILLINRTRRYLSDGRYVLFLADRFIYFLCERTYLCNVWGKNVLQQYMTSNTVVKLF